ncbi:hypothetical protein HY345_00680, partial [Candidatus Microgenomates bacterium]|nr:hypothetical protein [Candidatus Microgenomates bacterium]
MNKLIWAFSVVFFLGFFYLLYPQQIFAACNPPQDYSDCQNLQVSPFGTNLAGNISPNNFKALREAAIAANPENLNKKIQATIILTDGTIANTAKTVEILNAAKQYGLELTIRIWGAPKGEQALADGKNLLKALEQAGMMGARIEFANEPNLTAEGYTNATEYGLALSNFIEGCDGCKVYLPALGGPPGSEGQKLQFATELFKQFPNLAASVDGIIFNTSQATPEGAITDWANTLKVWQDAAAAAGVKLDTSHIFLTEVGPPGSVLDKGFIQEIADIFDQIKNGMPGNPYFDKYHDLFAGVEGLTFFTWDENHNAILVFVDANGKIETKKITELGGNLPSLSIGPGSAEEGTVLPFAHPSAESQTMCPPDDPYFPPLPGQNAPAPIANVTTTPPVQPGVLIPTPQLREGVDLFFGKPVKVQGDAGTKYCAQKQSEPIVLSETSYYHLALQKGCNERPWTGDLTVSNVQIPFAQAIADHWAGTLDTEHLTPIDFDRLISDAKLPDTVGLQARDEINLQSGVLKKMLQKEDQDKLKCEFIKYVFKRSYRKSTQYQNYKPDGITKLSAFASIPPGCRNQNECTDIDTSTPEGFKKKSDCMRGWDKKYGEAWSKIGLFPNEEAKGQLKFMVCGDKQYVLKTAVPEVFRLGLAANTLQQTMSPKEQMDEFYKAYPELEEPLSSENFVYQNLPKTIASTSLAGTKEIVEKMEKVPWLGRIVGYAKKFLPTMQTVFAQAQEIYKNPSRLLAQANTGPKPNSYNAGVVISCQLAPDKKSINLNMTITGEIFDAQGKKSDKVGDVSADLYLNGKKIEINGKAFTVQHRPGSSESYTLPVDPNINNYNFTAHVVLAPNGKHMQNCDSGQISPTDVSGCIIDINQNITQSTSAITKHFSEGGACFVDNGKVTVEPKACGMEGCDFSVKPLTPTPPQPDTQVFLWDPDEKNYDADGKVKIGTPDPVKFRFENNPSAQDLADCLAHPLTDCIDVATNLREVGVYNNVPMLWTTWLQAAGKFAIDTNTTLSGFLYNIKPLGITGPAAISPFDLGNFCSSKQDDVLDQQGNFKEIDAQGNVTYNFTQTGGKPVASLLPNGVNVSMASPSLQHLLYYRLKGLCNANKWWSERVLNPLAVSSPTDQIPYTTPEGGVSYDCTGCGNPLKDFEGRDTDPQSCSWQNAGLPAGNTGKCIHFLPDYRESDLPTWINRLKEMGMNWALVPYHDENQLAYAAKAFKEAGITPVFRFMYNGGLIQTYKNYDWQRDINILINAGLSPYIQIFNEPSDDREWNNKKVGTTAQFANAWLSNAIRVYNAGGKPGLQVQDTAELQAVIDLVKQYYPNKEDQN